MSQSGAYEVWTLSRTDVIEGPEAKHVLSAAEVGLHCYGVGGGFACCVRVGRPHRRILADRELIDRNRAIDFGAGDHQDASLAAFVRGVEDVLGSFDVGSQRPNGIVPRCGHVRLGSEVIDDVGVGVGDSGTNSGPIRDVWTAGSAGEGHDVVA